MIETVKQYPMGADVPEWLITLEPRSPQSTKGNFRFAVDVDVIETDQVFIVVPRVFGRFNAVIDTSGTTDCVMFAPGKPTRVVQVLTDLFAQGMAPLVPLMPDTLQVEVVDRTDTQVTVVPDPHPTFWQRLRYAFTGR